MSPSAVQNNAIGDSLENPPYRTVKGVLVAIQKKLVHMDELHNLPHFCAKKLPMTQPTPYGVSWAQTFACPELPQPIAWVGVEI